MYTPGSETTTQYVPMPQVTTKNIEEKPKKVKAILTKLDFPNFIKQLIKHSSYAHQLYVQAHLNHLNYEGNNFLAIHAFLKEQYELHTKQFDKLAEFVRSMDYLMPMCGCGLKDAYLDFKNVTSYDNKAMLLTYLKNLEDFGMQSKTLGIAAKEIQAPDVENYTAELVDDSFKSAWFLKATLRNG
jgi:DNA-binding ferritin-like protein